MDRSITISLRTVQRVLLGGLIAAALGSAAWVYADSATPVLVPYTGRLELDGVPAQSPHDLQFSLHFAESGGSAQWTETHSNVPVHAGRFGVLLGSVSAFPADVWEQGTALWLGIAVRPAGEGSFTPLGGRQRLAHVPLAARAATAKAGGPNFTVSGTLTIQGPSGTATDRVSFSSAGDLTLGEDADITNVDRIIGYNDLRLQGSPSSGANNVLITEAGNVATSGNVAVGGDLSVTGDLTVGGSLLAVSEPYTVTVNDVGGSTTRSMLSSSKAICFLTHVSMEDFDAVSEVGTCTVSISGSTWVLTGSTGSTPDANIACSARCLSW